MKAHEFERRFDEGEDVSSALNLRKARRVGQVQRRVNVDFPVWMIEALDREAGRLGVTRVAAVLVAREDVDVVVPHSRPSMPRLPV